MPLMRWLSVVMLSFLITACGGGGSLEKDGGSIGDGATVQPAYTISVVGSSASSSQLSNQVTLDEPLIISATLLNNGTAVSGEIINFSLNSSIGLLEPESGTALTDDNGIAAIKLTAGANQGAGIVTASYAADEQIYSVNFGFSSDGSEGEQSSGSVTLSVTIVDQNGAPFSESNPVSKDNKGTVTATLFDDENPLVGQLISFSTNFTGKITPELGTALTNENGEAKVTLSSGNFKGAGQVIATYTSETGDAISKTAGFISSGDDAPVESAQAELDIKLLQGCNANWDANRNTVSLNPLDPSTGCTVTNQFSSDELIDVLVKVTDISSGDGISGIITELTTDLGRLLPDSGKALTDNFGFALLKLQPGANSGAGSLTATAKGTNLDKAFSISTVELSVAIDNGLPNLLDAAGNPIADEYQPLAAGATTVITVEIKDVNGNLIKH